MFNLTERHEMLCYFFSYRINRAFDENLLQAYTPEKRMFIVCQRIIEAVDMHKRALESVYNADIFLLIYERNIQPGD